MLNFDNLLIAIAVFAVGALVVFGIQTARQNIHKIEDENLRSIVDFTLVAVEKVVRSFNQRIVDQKKKDGKFDIKSAREVKKQGLEDIKEIVGETSLDILDKGLGNVDKFLDNALESEVRKQKN